MAAEEKLPRELQKPLRQLAASLETGREMQGHRGEGESMNPLYCSVLSSRLCFKRAVYSNEQSTENWLY